MGWQRFNRTSNVFEVSDNNGASWTPLVIAPSGLYPYIAYTNLVNNFISEQDFTGGSATPYNTAPIEIRMASHPRVSFHWPGVMASQIGMDTTGTIRTYDNPGTGYEKFRCGGLICNNIQSGYVFPGDYYSGAIQSSYFITQLVQSNYNIYINTGVRVAGALTADGLIYPGALTGGNPQTNWYLASHSSYGLYSNTGFYAANFQCPGAVYPADGIFERGRGTRLGDHINYTPTLSAATGQCAMGAFYHCKYVLIGKTCMVGFSFQIYNNTLTGWIGISMPAGLSGSEGSNNVIIMNTGYAMATTTPSTNIIYFYTSGTGGASWDPNWRTFAGTVIFPV